MAKKHLTWKDVQTVGKMFIANGLEKEARHTVLSHSPSNLQPRLGRRETLQKDSVRGQAGVGEAPFLSFSFIPSAAGGREGGLWPSLGLERSLLAACVGRPGG